MSKKKKGLERLVDEAFSGVGDKGLARLDSATELKTEIEVLQELTEELIHQIISARPLACDEIGAEILRVLNR